MINKRNLLLLIIIFIVALFSIACDKKQYTREEAYDKFEKQISKITSYSCIAKVEAKGNKGNTTYIFKQTYTKPDYYKLEIQSPKELEGKSIEYKGESILIENKRINDKVKLTNEIDNTQYLFVGEFIKNAINNDSSSLEIKENELKITSNIIDDDKRFDKQVLYIDTKTKKPIKMEIIDKQESTIFKVVYEDFEYQK